MLFNNGNDLFNDPYTNIHNPSAAKIPDVTHILNRTFGKLFAKDLLKIDTIKNLSVSADVDDSYHRRYVEQLKEAQLKKENKIQNYIMLKKHLIESKAKALESNDEVNESKSNNYDKKSNSTYKYCVNHTLLKQNNLIAPSDYTSKQAVISRDDVSNSCISLSDTSLMKIDFPNMNQADLEILDKTMRQVHSKNNKLDKLPSSVKKNANHLERIENRNNLKLYENKTRFLTNPRTKILDSCVTQAVKVFKSIPSLISFEKYMIGKVYETRLEIRNTSLTSQQFKIVPPKTEYFSLSLGAYPQPSSIIAPGMSVLYNIKFAPDSLCLFEDEIAIECCNGTLMNIPIIAKRKSPVLSIPRRFDCGKALIGQMKVCRFIIKNNGGEGRFAILPKSTWLSSCFKTNISSSVLSIFPFEVQPSIFEIQENDTIVVEVIFKPTDTKLYEHVIVVACDNCTSLEFQISGQGEIPKIELLRNDTSDANEKSVNTFLTEDEFRDMNCSEIIRFDDVNPNVVSKQNFLINNNSSSPIDYTWVIYKPNYENNFTNDTVKPVHACVQDKQSPFEITPKQGVLDRYSSNPIEFSFKPLKPGIFDSVAHLILHGLPDITKQMMNDKTEQLHKTSLNKEDIHVADLTFLQLEFKGKCEAIKIALDPPAIYVPGCINPLSTMRKSFRMINISSSPIRFNWKQIVGKHIIEVEPSYGEIAPKSYGLMEALITGTGPEHIKDTIDCFVEFMEEPLNLYIEAEVKVPDCIIHGADIDFNLVRVGSLARANLLVENTSNLKLTWNLSCLDDKERIFSFEEFGTLNPLETKTIQITLLGKSEMIVEKFFEFKILDDESTKTIKCIGQIQNPIACFMNSNPPLDDLYVGQKKSYVVELCNQTMLETSFEFKLPVFEEQQIFTMDIMPRIGLLGSNQKLEITIEIIAKEIGYISDVNIPCFVGGMSEPLFINLNGPIHGVSMLFSVSDYNQPNQDDFNTQNFTVISFDALQINTNVSKCLFIKNTTPIDTLIDLKMRNFELKTYQNGQVKSGQHDILKPNHLGITFSADKKRLKLRSFETAMVVLTVCPTIWGDYIDDLEINAENMESSQKLPIYVDAIGNPVKMYAGIVFEENKDEIPIIRFGAQIKSNRMITRKLKIQNLCTNTYEIDWKVYLINPNDLKLINLNIVPFKKLEDNLTHSQTTIYSDNSESKSDCTDHSRLVQINLTPHFGEQSRPDSAVFSMGSKKSALKPHGRLSLDIMLDLKNVSFGIHEAMFVGYINLDDETKQGNGFYRKTMFELTPLKFKAHVEIIPPKLKIEIDEEELAFEASLGALIENACLLTEKVFTKNIFISNILSIPVEFDLHVEHPFCLQTTSCSSLRLDLKPREKTKINVLFRMHKDFISFENQVSQQNYTDYNGLLNVCFNGESNQQIPINAKVHISNIILNTSYIDFGRVLVGKTSCKQFIMRNSSKCSTMWSLDFPNPTKAYSCDITTGILNAGMFYKTKDEQLITVFFHPQHDFQYDEDIFIKDDLTGLIKHVKLCGTGSYDEQNEPKF